MNHKGCLRILSAIAFLVLLFSSGALAWKGEQTAVDSGVLRMEEVPIYGLNLSAMNMKIHESLSVDGAIPPLESLMEEYGSTFEIISMSPDGSSALGWIDNHLIGIRGSSLIPVFVWNETRGVRDEYGYAQFYQKAPAKKWLDHSGVAWSPDGRYAVMVNGWAALTTARFGYAQLYILDLERAEVYLAATWGNNIKNMGSVICPSFDGTGRYIYFSHWGKEHTYPFAFMRYDMETGLCETLSESSSWLASYPGLWETSQQEWIGMQDGNGGETIVAHYRPAKNGWECRLSMISAPKRFFEGRTLLYLRESNQAAIIGGRNTKDGNTRFTLITPDDGTFTPIGDGLQGREVIPQYFTFIRRPDSDEISMITYATEEEYQLALNMQGSVQKETAHAFAITAADVSPDGRFLLMSIAREEESHLVLMDGATKFFRIIDCPEALSERLRFYGSDLSGYKPGLEWSFGNSILAETGEGVRLFRLTGLEEGALPLRPENASGQADTRESGVSVPSAHGWTCPNCGREGNESAFCPDCGTQRPEEKASWTCPGCGREGNEGAFCPNCGAKRPEIPAAWTCPNCGREGNEGAFCPDCGTQRPEEKASWTCPGCGREGNEGAFCPNCGTKRP